MITPASLAPLGVTVLDPDHIREPEKDGLLRWLQTHPAGYVQIEEPVFLDTDGLTSRFWVTVACVATSRAQAQALSDAALHLLAGDSAEPGLYELAVDDRARMTAPGVYACRRAFTLTTIGGHETA